MTLFARTVNIRVYKCPSCSWQGKKTEFVYTGRKKGLRTCPECGAPVKRLHTEQQEVTP